MSVQKQDDFGAVVALIEAARKRTYQAVNADAEIEPALLSQLPWTHHLIILGQSKRSEERGFYLRKAALRAESTNRLTALQWLQIICMECKAFAIISVNKTRQGYARKRILKPAGYSFLGCAA